MASTRRNSIEPGGKPAVDLSVFDAAISPSGQRLRLDVILDALDETRQAQLRAALADPKYSGSTIARVCCQWGQECSSGAVMAWRRRYGTGR